MAAATSGLRWMRLSAALRAALACTIVAGITLFGPAAVRNLLSRFSSISYVTTISILFSDVGTVGEAVRGGWQVVGAMIPVFISSVPCLWLIGPARFDSWLAAVAVAASAFVVALPERTSLLTKRIAFAQLVVVYVGTVVHGGQTGFLMHPVRVVSSTAIGAVASVLATLILVPRLSSSEVKKLCGIYSENAGERLDLLVEGFGAKTKAIALASVAQANSLSVTATKLKLLHILQANLGGMVWERPWIKIVSPNYMAIGEKLQRFEVALRGMETALACPSFAFGTMDEELCNSVKNLKAEAILQLERVIKSSESPNAATAPETTDAGNSSPWPPKIIAITYRNLPVSFFLRCVDLLLYNSNAVFQNRDSVVENDQKANGEEAVNLPSRGLKSTRWGILSSKWPTTRSVCFALKCSIILGLAVFLGLTYNKQNGYWSGLTVAISFATERQAIFTVANGRAQGTTLGSFYGVIWCFILRRFEYLWLLPLLPWVVFSSFLIHSRMYGQAGGIAAALGALLILGRKNYGRPSEFANARIAEAFIGLLCFVMVETFFNRSRAATLAKVEFSKCLESVEDCIKRVNLIFKSKKLHDSSIYVPLEEQLENLKSHVNQLEKFIVEAGFEPNFWFTPFQGACYSKFLKSLQRIVDILQFLVHEMKFLSLESNRSGLVLKELPDKLSEDLELFYRNVGCSLRFMEKVTLIKSLKELQNTNQNLCDEMEMGVESPNSGCRALALSEEEVEKIVSSFCQHANEVVSKVYTNESEANLKGQMTLCLSSIGFCIKCLMTGTMEMERELHGLMKLENPSVHMNLQEISQKINAHGT